MTDCEIVPYHPDLETELAELRNLTWGTDLSVAKQYLAWKYQHNPYFAQPILYIALQRGRVIGMRGAYGTCWEAEGAARVVIPALDDFTVLPAHRNTGVATLIMRSVMDDLAKRGFPLVVALSAGRMTALVSLAMGWKSAGAMEPVSRYGPRQRLALAIRGQLRGRPLLWRLVRRDPPPRLSPEGPFERLGSPGRYPGRAAGSTIVFERIARAEAMAALIRRLGHDGRIRQVRDAEFLAWRYQGPTREYGFLYLEREGQLEGFLAIGRYPLYQPPLAAFHFVDLEGTTLAVREELLTAAVQRGRFPEVGAWAGWTSAEDRLLLARAGFVPNEASTRARGLPCLLVRGLDATPANEWRIGRRSLTEHANWDMRLVYSMHG